MLISSYLIQDKFRGAFFKQLYNNLSGKLVSVLAHCSVSRNTDTTGLSAFCSASRTWQNQNNSDRSPEMILRGKTKQTTTKH